MQAASSTAVDRHVSWWRSAFRYCLRVLDFSQEKAPTHRNLVADERRWGEPWVQDRGSCGGVWLVAAPCLLPAYPIGSAPCDSDSYSDHPPPSGLPNLPTFFPTYNVPPKIQPTNKGFSAPSGAASCPPPKEQLRPVESLHEGWLELI
eukprot:366309-Chlamydomonas_euryale.AAC.2